MSAIIRCATPAERAEIIACLVSSEAVAEVVVACDRALNGSSESKRLTYCYRPASAV